MVTEDLKALNNNGLLNELIIIGTVSTDDIGFKKVLIPK